MKHTFKYILSILAFVPFSLMAQTQYHVANGVATAKSVEPENGKYKVTLETYATGESTVVETGIPADIVLVLDVSGSMADNMYEYTATESRTWRANNVGNNHYIYVDGAYYLVRTYNNNLYYGDNWTYIGSSYTGVLYTRASLGSKMSNLITAVNAFIEDIASNDVDVDEGEVGNQIAIVKFAGNKYTGSSKEGDDTYRDNGNTYNYTQIVRQFRPVATDKALLKQSISSLQARGATSVDYGMAFATSLFSDLIDEFPDRESTKTVVMFTDGQPTHSSNFEYSVARDAVKEALALKNMDITVFSVGVFDSETTDIKEYMEHVSSNYPTADATISGSGTGNSINYTGTRLSDDKAIYYQNASGSDLTSIFKSIAESSGSSTRPVGAQTQVRDMVTSSFKLPAGTKPTDITVEVWKINSNGIGWTKDTQYDMDGIAPTLKKQSYTEAGTTVECDAIYVEGFEYSAEDETDNDGTGNWVGIRIPDPEDLTQNFYAGRKLVISFYVEAKDGVTGGDTQTNTSDSGVYIYDPATNTYTCVNHYTLPETQLPINLKITKNGLRSGESATFKVMKIAAKKKQKVDDDGNPVYEVDEEGEYILDDEGNKIPVMEIVYNALGKPVPDENATPDPEEDDPIKALGWENWSKVILTNKGSNGAEVSKTLLNLDPNFVYLIVEDDWSWAYTTTGSAPGIQLTTSNVPVNPFSFTNKEKTGVVKHAEAVTINHFGYTIQSGDFQGKQEEHYKSSKVESFTTPTN